jgi:hypothetical protein
MLIMLFAIISSAANAQTTEVVMADGFYSEGKIYVVIGVVMLIFTGIIIYLISLDRKLNRIEKALKEKN